MTAAMLKHCAGIAIGIALASTPAQAIRVEPRPEPVPIGTVEQYFTGMLVVDGIPVFRQGYRVWDGTRWVPIPSTHQGERPIPRRQRRME